MSSKKRYSRLLHIPALRGHDTAIMSHLCMSCVANLGAWVAGVAYQWVSQANVQQPIVIRGYRGYRGYRSKEGLQSK
eukprot:448105-Pelagomonas_calceolata.AAC.1